jgi:hypothetical protein
MFAIFARELSYRQSEYESDGWPDLRPRKVRQSVLFSIETASFVNERGSDCKFEHRDETCAEHYSHP